jgi:hypothetical protein
MRTDFDSTSRLSNRERFASNAVWVIPADLYPNAECVTGHDSGEIVRGGGNPTDKGEADMMVLAVMNLPSATPEAEFIHGTQKALAQRPGPREEA